MKEMREAAVKGGTQEFTDATYDVIKTVTDSFSTKVLPFSTDESVRDEYTSFTGGVRTGK